MSVIITEADFDIAVEHEKLKVASAGALVTFTGTLRDLTDGEHIKGMILEHYPGMTESEIGSIIQKAKSRWPLEVVTVIHRIGRIYPLDNIVFVGCSSMHRHDAFEAAMFIMDFLKTKAPFWKKEFRKSGPSWVDAREIDYKALRRWNE
mgnify:CR=1 FL=1